MVHWNAYIAYSSWLSTSWFSLWNKNPLLWVKVTITMSGWDYTSTMKPYVCVYVLRPFFRIVLGSEQNWGEGAESSQIPPSPTYARPPALSTSSQPEWDICCGWWPTLTHLNYPGSTAYTMISSWPIHSMVLKNV